MFVRIDEAGDWATKTGHVVWIGLHEPSEELLRRVQRQFGLHELAIEDALHAHQRPKIEQYWRGLLRRGAHGADAGHVDQGVWSRIRQGGGD